MSLPAKKLVETFQLTTSVMMEQQTKDDRTASKTSPSIRLKQHHSTTDTLGLDDNQKVVTSSDSSKSLDVNINTLETSGNQQPTETGIMNCKFVRPSEEGCSLAPEENFELPLAASKSLRTRKVWRKALEEEHAA